MPWYLAGVYLHLVGGVLLGGYALFWLVMALGLRSEHELDAEILLARVGRSRWPPFGLPKGLRVPILGLGWLLVLLLVGSGVGLLASRGMSFSQLLSAALAGSGFAQVLVMKLVLVAVFIGAHARLSARAPAGAAIVAAASAALIVCFSAMLV